MKIKTKDGSVIDLEALREHWFLIGGTPFMTVASHDVLVVIEALYAALSVTDTELIDVDNVWDDGYEKGYNDALATVRKSANMIEEKPVAD